ncbi:MAG: MBOAT family O-acyltransferase [Sphingorhabdus sp.]
MIFSEPFFLFLFLPLSCLIFHAVGKRFGQTGALATIFIMSLIFYLPWGWWMTGILAASVIVNYISASLMLWLPDNRKHARAALLVAGELYNILTLIWFKYNVFDDLFGNHADMQSGAWIIPVGISFYSFQQAALLADAYAREKTVTKFFGQLSTLKEHISSFVKYAAFVIFFPQLVIGPIIYMKEFEPQIANKRFGRIEFRNFAIGFALVAIGLFKKIVIADNLAPGAEGVFSSAAQGIEMHPIAAWIGVACYYLQLYFDFSGYTDIALGLARIFGIRYPINFFSPFKAVGIIDYYRRWHMTLTRVISRFLFTPLSIAGTRFAAQRRLPALLAKLIGLWLPLMINFEVIGLWHGALSTFVLFGIIHGTWYVVETEVRTSKRWKAWKRKTPDWRRAIYGRIVIIALMPLTFALFRADSISTFGFLLEQLFAGNWAADFGISVRVIPFILFGFFIVYFLPNSVELLKNYRPGIMTFANKSYGPNLFKFCWRPNWGWSVLFGSAFVVCLYYAYRQPPFLYQGF